jgi:hypothetical protein
VPTGPLFAGIAAGSAAVSTLSGMVKRAKGRRRALLLELRENLTLLYESLRHGLSPDETIRRLGEGVFRSLWGTNFSFAALQRRRVSRASARGFAVLDRYVGWKTERVFEILYARISNLRKIVEIGYEPARVRMRRRLGNLFLLHLLLVRHLES